MKSAQFIQIPIAQLTTSLKDFQGRAVAYAPDTYSRIISEVQSGTFNPTAMPPIQIWLDPRTNEYVILAGHSRTASYSDLASGKLPMATTFNQEDFKKIPAQVVQASTLEDAKKIALSSQGTPQERTISVREGIFVFFSALIVGIGIGWAKWGDGRLRA